METEKYKELMNKVKHGIYDIVDKITDDYVEGFVETVDYEIANIRENRDFYQGLYWKYEKALSLACEAMLKLQGHFPTEDDFIEKRIELEDSFLEKDE